MRKMTVIFLVIVVMLITLVGCTRKDDKQSVEKYVEDLGIREYEIVDEPIEWESNSGETNRAWTVCTKDQNEVAFIVTGTRISSTEWSYRGLVDDYEDRLLKRLFEMYKEDGGETEGFDFYEVTSESSGLISTSIFSLVDTKDELDKIVMNLESFVQYIQGRGYSGNDVFFDTYIHFDYPGRNIVHGEYMTQKWVRGSTVQVKLSYLPDEEISFANVYEEYICFATEYGFIDRLDDFTAEEVETALQNKNGTTFLNVNGSVQKVPYVNTKNNPSYGAVYYLLEAAGIEVTGTPEHYSFTSVNGKQYEFSYDFIDEVSDEIAKEEKLTTNYAYYYFVDGEKVETYDDSSSISVSQFYEMTHCYWANSFEDASNIPSYLVETYG